MSGAEGPPADPADRAAAAAAQPRPALLLGAGGGLASALARGLAAEGRALTLAGRDVAGLRRDAADLALRHGVEVAVAAWDARDLGAAGRLFDAMVPAPDLVVCCVGAMESPAAHEGDPDALRAVVESNFLGPVQALAELAERLAALSAREGAPTTLVGVGSVAGVRGRAANWPYGAAKAGLDAALSGLRQRHARGGPLVITVRPGRIATRMTDGIAGPAPLTRPPEAEAAAILRAIRRRRPLVVAPAWRLIEAALRLTPERLFMRLRF